eukprot:c3807_g1_i1.p1 GENE.c3807_g1_i1~~c3807_g1_i1.p1  ORF type:complete len:136 (-),score=64.90 c3807_g1_i1:178-528(-)
MWSRTSGLLRQVSRQQSICPLIARRASSELTASDQNPELVRPSIAIDSHGHYQQVFPGDPRFRRQLAEITIYGGKKITLQAGEVVADVHATLEWTLPSPPPLHQFAESPIVKETTA